MANLSYFIVNNGFLRVADIFEAESAPGTVVIGQDKNLPQTLNQQWQLNVKAFNFSTSIYTVSLQALGPTSFAVPSGDSTGVVTGTSEIDWFLDIVTAPFGGATTFRIGESPDGPYWTAQSTETEQIQLQANNNAEAQLWTFIEVFVPNV